LRIHDQNRAMSRIRDSQHAVLLPLGMHESKLVV
jgi:hypothetical protein